jgi:hypothetical protein
MRRASVMIVAAVLGTGSAWAQEEADAHRTAVSVVGGLSVGSSRSFGPFGAPGSDAGFVAGGGIARDLSSRVTLEANGLYLDRGASAWSADLGFRLNLVPSRESLVPYFAASAGLYGESYETIGGRLEIGRRAGSLPAGRLGRFVRGAFRVLDEYSTLSGDTSRTDGMVTFGGGVRFASGSHVFVRPDVRAQVVFGGDTRVLGLFTLNFGYRF